MQLKQIKEMIIKLEENEELNEFEKRILNNLTTEELNMLRYYFTENVNDWVN